MLSESEAASPAPFAAIRERMASRDLDTARAVKKAGGYLGVLLQNLASAYDPACIVLGGAMVELGEPFLGPATRTLNEYATAAKLDPPVLRISRFGADAVASGAAALARYRLTRPLMAGRSQVSEEAA